jgi:hypothetical protein
MSQNNIIIMEFSTTQISAFRIACEVIDNLVHDVNLEVSADGIKIRETDPNSKLFLSVWFAGGNFDLYNYLCEAETGKFDVGIDIGNIVSSLTQRLKYDVLRFKVYSDFSIRLELESYKRDEVKTVKLKKIEALPFSDYSDILPVVYSHSVTLSTELFSKYCKDIIRTSQGLLLKLNKNKLIISKEDESLEYSINGKTKHNLQIILQPDNKTPNDFVSSMLPSKYFSILSKLSNISELVSIMIGGNPTMIKYNLGSLGELKLVLF